MNNLEKKWRMVAKDLDLEIIAPFEFNSNDICIQVEVLLKGYGARNGMLITSDYEKIVDYRDCIIENGYGFSVLSVPQDKDLDRYDANDYIELLEDWGKTTTDTVYD